MANISKKTNYTPHIVILALFLLIAIFSLLRKRRQQKEAFTTCAVRTRLPNSNDDIISRGKLMWKRVDGELLLGIRDRAPGSVPVIDFLAETPAEYKAEIANGPEQGMCPRQTALDAMERDKRASLWSKIVKTPSKLSQPPPPEKDLAFCNKLWGNDPVMTLGKVNCYRKLYGKPFIRWDRELEQLAWDSPNSCQELYDNDGSVESIVVSAHEEPTDGIQKIYENEFECYDPALEQGLPGCSATDCKNNICYNNVHALLGSSIKSIGCAYYPYCGPGSTGKGILLRCKHK